MQTAMYTTTLLFNLVSKAHESVSIDGFWTVSIDCLLQSLSNSESNLRKWECESKYSESTL